MNNENFEKIKNVEKNGSEFWYARDLQKLLNYKDWYSFKKIVLSIKELNLSFNDEIKETSYTVKLYKNAVLNKDDFKLSRKACYFITLSSDSRKKAVRKFRKNILEEWAEVC